MWALDFRFTRSNHPSIHKINNLIFSVAISGIGSGIIKKSQHQLAVYQSDRQLKVQSRTAFKNRDPRQTTDIVTKIQESLSFVEAT
jgi:hypothetical protein